MKNLLFVIMAMALVGCGGDVGGISESRIVQHTELVNGRRVECIVFDGYNSGGLSCNWEAYNNLQNPSG